MSKKRPCSKLIKCELFLKCGRIDMYNMQEYAKEKLQLHHDPPFRITHHTIYEEYFILSEEGHTELHKLELDNKEEYNARNKRAWFKTESMPKRKPIALSRVIEL